jgi:hypothetical protein
VDDARASYEMAARFYFANVPDPVREEAFRKKLGAAAAP